MKSLLHGLLVLLVAAGLLILVAPANADEPKNASQPGQKPDEGLKVIAIYPHKAGENFQTVTTGNVTVYYMEGWKDAAQKIAAKTDECIKSALALVSIEPQGTCEITLRPMKLEKGTLAGSVQTTDLKTKMTSYPMAAPEGGAATYSTDSLEAQRGIASAASDACSMAMQLAQPNAAASDQQWFTGGISGYLALKTAALLGGNDAARVKQLCDMQYADKILEHYRGKLLDWNYSTTNAWAYGAGCAQMFVEIEKKFGADAVKKIGEGFTKAEKTDKDSLVKIIDDAIGTNLVEFLGKYEASKYPQLGVVPDAEYKGPGVRASSVVPDSSAEKAGIAADDILLKANGKDINALADLQAAVKEAGVGGEVKFDVKRGDAEKEVTAKIGEPAFHFPPDPEPKKPEPDKPADKY